MKPELENINDIYLQIEDYILPDLEYLDTKRQGQEYIKKIQEYEPVHASTKRKFLTIAPFLTPEEIIEGYEQGCRLLQANLSGLMYRKFDRKYIPVMLKAINDDHGHAAHLFFRALTLYASDRRADLIPLILNSLMSRRLSTKQAALSAAHELKVAEALPRIQEMSRDSVLEIREMAEGILSDWIG